LPIADVNQKYLVKNGSEEKGAQAYDIVVGESKAERAATVFSQGDFADYVKIVFGKVDAWFEEDERIYLHPRDPYKVSISFFLQSLQTTRA
jgi:hypothetical protein